MRVGAATAPISSSGHAYVVVSASFRYDGMQPEALAMFPSITPAMFAGSPIEEAYLRLARVEADPVLAARMSEGRRAS